MMSVLGLRRDFSRRLLKWYDRSRRDLPWRVSRGSRGRLDPYRVLVSETMLQQTQVATVIPYFLRFIERFPTLRDLAAAPEQEVLRLWQGLGYYSRARNLQRAAQQVVRDYRGVLPGTAEELLKLPGIGRYTAGAVASIGFGQPAPILDGNVTRVLCRLDHIGTDPRSRDTQQRLWLAAGQLLPRNRVGDFNSALMELGALVCTPRGPQCLVCPVREHCQAHAAGVQERVPAPRASRPTPLLRRQTYCISDGSHWLIEQRPSRGRWAGLWQFVTLDPSLSSRTIITDLLPVRVGKPKRLCVILHALTHRRYEFEVSVAVAASRRVRVSDQPRRWVSLREIDQYPLPRPHLRIVELLKTLVR